MKNKKIETRFYDVNLETRAEGEIGLVKGRPIVFGSRTDLGWFDEIIDPGALDKTDLTDVRFCLNHDTSYVYARSRRNNPNSTMRLFPGMEGLDIEADLAIGESARAKDLYTAIEREDINKMSFMFVIEDEEWENLDSEHPLRRIKSISTVYEVSAVTFPAYDSTEIYARDKDALDNARQTLEKARQSRAKLPDGNLELLKEKTKILGGII